MVGRSVGNGVCVRDVAEVLECDGSDRQRADRRLEIEIVGVLHFAVVVEGDFVPFAVRRQRSALTAGPALPTGGARAALLALRDIQADWPHLRRDPRETVAAQPGDVVEGVVKNVTDFGAFIDLGGADGLLHISEMSWGRIENPKKVFHSGDHVTVLIKDIIGTKIALSLKFPDQNPWIDAAEKYAPGNIVVGVVARMTDFGAFVELEPGVDALLHVSQIARRHIEKPADVLQIGQEIEAQIVDFNEADRKISLSMKALEMPQQQNADEIVYSETEAAQDEQ